MRELTKEDVHIYLYLVYKEKTYTKRDSDDCNELHSKASIAMDTRKTHALVDVSKTHNVS